MTAPAPRRWGRVVLFGVTGLLWLASMGGFVAYEIFPARSPGAKLFWEKIFLRVAPFEELWYGVYYQENLLGGLRWHYEVVEEHGGVEAELRTSGRCNPLVFESALCMDAGYRVKDVSIDFTWGDIAGHLRGRVAGCVAIWHGKFGDREWNFKTPWQDDASMRTERQIGPDGTERHLFILNPDGMSLEALLNAQGVLERMDIPGGFSLRRATKGSVTAAWRDSKLPAALANAQRWFGYDTH